MALTTTRTRTQTALTKLAAMIANVHGELEFVEEQLRSGEYPPGKALSQEVQKGLEKRHQALLANRDALYLTLNQFDTTIEPTNIVASNGWIVHYGSKRLGAKTLVRRIAAY